MKVPPMPFESRQRETLTLAPNARLSLVNNNGTIDVVGWDRPELAIETFTCADNRGKLGRVTPTLTESRKELRFEIVEKYLSEDTYDYRRDGPGKEFYPALTMLKLMVPRAISLKIQSHNADISLKNLWGALDITTFNGKLLFEAARGADQSVTGHTFNGELIVPEPAFVFTEPRRREARATLGRGRNSVKLDSFNGKVEVR
jgi:hypothetical protein